MDLIAEPWAIGGNSYQVGGFPSGWAEWNGIYRDSLRKKQNQMGVEAVTPAELATASPAPRTCTATTAASPGIRSTSWSPTTASP